MSARYDDIVVGAGHNGLVAAFYLANAGRSVLVLERSEVVGGVVRTREFVPGFRASAALQSAETLSPRVIKEMGLAAHGLDLARPGGSAVAAPEGWLCCDGSGRPVGDRVAATDRDSLAQLEGELRRLVAVLAPMYEAPLPDIDSLGVADTMDLLKVGWRLRRLGKSEMRSAMRVLPMSMRDYVEERLEAPALRALVAGLGSPGAAPGPYAAGTLFRAIHDQLSNPRPLLSGPVFPRGGMGSVSEAMASAARAAGAEVRCLANVVAIDTDLGAARGVTLDGGDHLEAANVLSSVGVRSTFLSLLDGAALTPEFAFAAGNVRARPGVALVCFALDGLPATPEHSGADGTLAGRIQIGATVQSIEQAFDNAPRGGLPDRPFVQLTFPSLADDTLVDGDGHVAAAWVQAVPGCLGGRGGDPDNVGGDFGDGSDGDGDGWDRGREMLARSVAASIDEVLPGFSARIVGHDVAAPPDLERRFGVDNGCLFGADLTLDQSLFLRPIPGWSQYRTPVAGLYLCGAGTHGGGGISGLAGRNAARQLLAGARRGGR